MHLIHSFIHIFIEGDLQSACSQNAHDEIVIIIKNCLQTVKVGGRMLDQLDAFQTNTNHHMCILYPIRLPSVQFK